jgi:hypothetical protein
MTKEELERAWAEARLPRPAVNVAPLADVTLRVRQLVREGRLGIGTTFDVSATAEREVGGTLNPETLEFSGLDSTDETLATLARQLVAAVGESKMLSVLEGAKTVSLGVRLDRQDVSALLTAVMPSADRAHKTADGYAALSRLAAADMPGTPEASLYERLRFASEGEVFKISFEMSREEAAGMFSNRAARNRA